MSDESSDGIIAFTPAGGMQTTIETPPRGGEPGTRTVADVPRAGGGENLAPSPVQLLLAALAACKGMTARAYATRKGWPLHDVRVTARHIAAADPPRLEAEVELFGPLTAEQRERIMAIIEGCHVQKIIESAPEVVSRLTPPA